MALRALALVALFGCPATPATPSSPSGEHITRLISLSPALTDTVVALGAADLLVGVSAYCTLPKGIQAARLGGVQDLPLEAIVQLQPTLIVTSDSKHGPAKRLRAAGLRVETLSEGGLDAVTENISRLGVLLRREAQGRSLRQRLTDSLGALAPQPGAANPGALVVFSSEGEPVRQAWAAGPGGWLGELIELVGLDNVLSNGPSYVQLSAEGILTLQPDLIIELNGQASDQAPPIAERWGAFKQLPAVKTGRLHRLSGEALLRPGPRLIELAQALAKLR